MTKRVPIVESSPTVVAPLRDGRCIVVLDANAVILSTGKTAQRICKWDAARFILADYPGTAAPGCNPLRAVASGTITR
jgi:hypothetical protein